MTTTNHPGHHRNMSTRYAAVTSHDGKEMVLAGFWGDLAAYYKGSDGNAWQYHVSTRGWSNLGNYEEFKATFSKRRRGKLF